MAAPSADPPPAAHRGAALHLCALTNTPHTAPVAAPDGTIFDQAALLAHLRAAQNRHPSLHDTPLHPADLVPLRFTRSASLRADPSAPYRCAASGVPLAPGAVVVAVATSGAVYHWAALEPVCAAAGPPWPDPCDGSTLFGVEDVIALQGEPPRWLAAAKAAAAAASAPAEAVVLPPCSSIMDEGAGGGEKRRLPGGSAASVSPRSVGLADDEAAGKRRRQGSASPPLPRAEAAGADGVSLFSRGAALRTLPFSSDDERCRVYKNVRKGRKGKGYVRVHTTVGALNIELHCDKAPAACDNFLLLCARGFYDGLSWHRVVPGLAAETGDPTGTGHGGESAWGAPVRDEIRSTLLHDEAGVVSTVKSLSSNLSQWRITLAPAPQLDRLVTVFGKVVGDKEVIARIEEAGCAKRLCRVDRVEVLVDPILQLRQSRQNGLGGGP